MSKTGIGIGVSPAFIAAIPGGGDCGDADFPLVDNNIDWLIDNNLDCIVNGLAPTYAEKVLHYRPIAYWPLWEAVGGVAEDISGNGFDGAYTGVTLGQPGIGDGNTCPLFDGANDYVDVYSNDFRDNFPYDEGSFVGWMKVFNVGVWTDATRRAIMSFARDVGGANFYVDFTTPNWVDNTLIYFRDSGNNDDIQQVVAGQTFTAFVHFAVTWSVTSGNLKCYLAGSQIGATQAGVLAWDTDPIVAGKACIGSSTTVPASPFYGWLAHCAVFGSELSGTDIADMATA